MIKIIEESKKLSTQLVTCHLDKWPSNSFGQLLTWNFKHFVMSDGINKTSKSVLLFQYCQTYMDMRTKFVYDTYTKLYIYTYNLLTSREINYLQL